jgi:exopolysaccharide biosynthesis polyprenyl glycosylphosphotransferase
MLRRIRYQITLGLLIAVGVPILVQMYLLRSDFYVSTQIVTIIGAAAAIVLGYIGYRRLFIFPGIASGGYIITALSVSFGAIVALAILFRIDYSRLQIFSSYLLSICIVLYFHFRYERTKQMVVAFVPGGVADNLPEIADVSWRRIHSVHSTLKGVNSVVVDLHHIHDESWEAAITRWVLNGVQVYNARDAIEQLTGLVEITHISENTLGSLNPNAVVFKAKSVADFILSAAMILMLSPLLMLIAIAIRLDSPGPAIFRQERVGFRAKVFTVYKFRTMYVASEAQDAEQRRQRAITQSGDARITRLGRLLRRSRLDELPQLFNILKGEMSLIGPRPEALSLSRWYEGEIPFYHYRHIIKPGLTGWAQVNQGHVTDVNDVREKLYLDFYYVKNFSFWLDMLIGLRTAAIMVTGIGAR